MEEEVLRYYSQIRPVVNEIRAKYPGLQINFDGGYSLAQTGNIVPKALKELRQEIEEHRDSRPMYAFSKAAFNEVLALIDNKINEGDVASQANH